MSQEYKIRSLEDFCKVPPEKLDACLADFKQWVLMRGDLRTFFATLSNAVGKENAISVIDGFNWVDDGKQGLSGVTLHVKKEKDGAA